MSILSFFGLGKKEEPQSAVLQNMEGMPIHLNLDYSSKIGLRRIVSRLIRLQKALQQSHHSEATKQGYIQSIMQKEALLLSNDIVAPKTIPELETLLEELK